MPTIPILPWVNRIKVRNLARVLSNEGGIANNAVLTSTVYKAFPSFKDLRSSEKQIVFVRKLNMCCIIFDFPKSD